MTLKPWHQVVTPHKDISEGRFAQDQFAARLHDVLIPGVDNEYTNPRMFFDRTHLTEGLESLLREVLDRIDGKGNAPSVLQILTPFGGGKTHALLSLYHVVKNGKELEDHSSLDNLFLLRGQSGLLSAPVAVIDGNQIGADPFAYPDVFKVNTLWGHIAYQLLGKDGYEIVRENDQSRRCPSGDTIDQLLSACGKGLILLDEVVNYMESAAAISVLDSTLLYQTRTFLQVLTQNVGKHPHFALAATLPKSHIEVHGEASREEYERLKHVFERVQNLREPVKGEEIYSIIRRRLFADVGKKTIHQDVANAYMEDYKNRSNLPDEVKKTDYREKIISAYPFHPFLIDIFIRHVSTNPGFQKTRGALRLLGKVVADQYKKKRSDALIHAGDIDLENDEIRNELVELVEREFRNALEADIVGKTSNAALLDKSNGGDHERFNVAESIGTIAFLYTLEKGRASVGASENELHLGVARPELNKSVIFDSMRELKHKLHFIQSEGGHYKFDIHPNLPGILHDVKVREITDDSIKERVTQEVDRHIGRTPFETRLWVESHNDVPDSPNAKLILLSSKYQWREQGDKETEKMTMSIADHAGQGRRINRNTLIFLVADHREIQSLEKAIRETAAIEKVRANWQKYNLSPQQIKQLGSMEENSKKGIFASILRAFKYTGWVAPEGNRLIVEARGKESADRNRNISDYVLDFLKSRHRYLEDLMPLLITKFDKYKIWPPNENTLHLKDLPGYFRQYTHLPLLKDDEVLRKSVASGVVAGFFGFARGQDVNNLELLAYRKNMSSDEVKLEEGYYIVRSDVAEEIIRKKKEEEEKRKAEDIKISSDGKDDESIFTPDEVEFDDEESDNSSGKPVPPPTPPSPGSGSYKKVRISCNVPTDEFFNFYNGVIKPLISESEGINIKVEIDAQTSGGFNPGIIEDTVKETLYSVFGDEKAFRGE